MIGGSNCPICEEPLYADEEWQLRPGRPVGLEVEPGDYAHARCLSANEVNTDG